MARARSASIAALVATCAACTLLRSLDAYDAEWGMNDAGVDAKSDGLAPGRPPVRCTLFPIVDHGPTTGPASTDYLHGIAVAGDGIYLAAGPSAPRDGGLPLASEGTILRVDKRTAATRVLARGLPYVSSCKGLGDRVLCAVGKDVIAYDADGTAGRIGAAAGRVDDVCTGDAGIIAASSEPANGGTGVFALYPDRAGGAPTVERSVTMRLVAPIRLACDGEYVFAAAVNAVGVPMLRRLLDAPSLQLQCWAVTAGLSAPISQLAVTGGHIFFLGDNKRAAFSTGGPGDCEQSATYLEGSWLGLGGDHRFVFLRSHDEVRLLWADDPDHAVACSVPLGDAAVGATLPFGLLMQTAVFEGDDVYFIASPHVMRLHLETGGARP